MPHHTGLGPSCAEARGGPVCVESEASQVRYTGLLWTWYTGPFYHWALLGCQIGLAGDAFAHVIFTELVPVTSLWYQQVSQILHCKHRQTFGRKI